MGKNDTKRLKNVVYTSIWESDDKSFKPAAEYRTSITLNRRTSNCYEISQTSTLITSKSIHSDNVVWLITNDLEEALETYNRLVKGKFKHELDAK